MQKSSFSTYLEVAVPSVEKYSISIERPSLIGYYLSEKFLKGLSCGCSCTTAQTHYVLCTSSLKTFCLNHTNQDTQCCKRKDHLLLEIKQTKGKNKIVSGKVGTQKLSQGVMCGSCNEDTSRPVPACVFNGNCCEAVFHANCIFRSNECTMVICSTCFETSFFGSFQCLTCRDTFNTEFMLLQHNRLCRVVLMKAITKHPLLERCLRGYVCCGRKWKNRKKYNIHKKKCDEVKKKKEHGDDMICLKDDEMSLKDDKKNNADIPSLTSSFAMISVEEPKNPSPNVRTIVTEINNRKNMVKDIEL